ncbi:DUF6355 family natural product biosynthesis protein [Streptomyces sp. NPDC088348]|uniref:DUF6355 family natural product biosynthesis protein n=2 Tax=Streptomyces TaxID=1883 RepID=UPI0037FCB31F
MACIASQHLDAAQLNKGSQCAGAGYLFGGPALSVGRRAVATDRPGRGGSFFLGSGHTESEWRRCPPPGWANTPGAYAACRVRDLAPPSLVGGIASASGDDQHEEESEGWLRGPCGPGQASVSPEERTSMRSGRSPISRVQKKSRLGLAALTIVGVMALSPAAPADAMSQAPQRLAACGWNNPGTEHPFYEHCDSRTNVWIQVTRTFISGDYHRCVGPGKTVLDSNATGAWYDSGYRGGLCSHPGDTGP